MERLLPIKGLVRFLADEGEKAAVILTERGEAGFEDNIIPDTGMILKNAISDCVPCSLRFNLESALKGATEQSKPDVMIIELLSSASPLQIKESIEPMDIPDLSFDPIVHVVDASSFRFEIDKLPKFVITQIEESDILCLNKVDIADHEYLISVRDLLKTINPDARIFEFSAKMLDEGFTQFIDELAGKDAPEK
ncbi:GTP-binding protein [Methanohalophilus sp. RSK]|uniref:GTP-binding protein n=1 Tax=Methanohalophilus sp. RSK TaxID=2485783 RepID=UPI0013140215|nr:GTP-binding protein [Methanohalophilus sp. RSK]